MAVHPVLAWVGAALVPLVALALAGFVRRRRRVAAALGDPLLVASLAGEDLLAVPWARAALVLGAALALGAAIADPRWGAPAGAVEVQGGTVALVLDASGSMLTRDMAPDRLTHQRAAARALVRGTRGSAVGLVAFAGRAYALSPPTVDAGALDLYLSTLDPSVVTQAGSSLAAAIRQGLGLLIGGSDDGTPGALVLITDGDAMEPPERVLEAAELARRAGIPIHVVGLGTEAGAPVPNIDFRTGTQLGYKETAGGEVAVSRLNDRLLRQIAAATGGEYVALSEGGTVDPVLRALRERAGRAGQGSGPAERRARYGWFAAVALVLLGLEAVAPPRRVRRSAVEGG